MVMLAGQRAGEYDEVVCEGGGVCGFGVCVKTVTEQLRLSVQLLFRYYPLDFSINVLK